MDDWFLAPGEAIRTEHGVPADARKATLVACLVLGGLSLLGLLGLIIHPLTLALTMGLPALMLTIGLIGLWVLGRMRRFNRYILCDARIYAVSGRIFRRIHATTYEKITDVSLQQGPFARKYDYGHLIVRTAGGDVQFPYASAPVALRDAILARRDAFLANLDAVPASSQATQSKTHPNAKTGAQTTKTGASSASAAKHAKAPGKTRHRAPEQEVWTGKPAMATVVGSSLALLPTLLFMSPVLIFPAFLLHPALGVLAMVIALALAALAVWLFKLGRDRTTYTLTTHGVRVQRGIVTTQIAEAKFEKITDINLNQGIMGKIFGYGTVVLNTAGSVGAPVHFAGVENPEAVRQMVLEARPE